MEKKIRIALIATYPRLSDIFLKLVEKRPSVVGESIYASFERAVEIAKEMEKNGDADVILSRGGTAAQIKNAVDIPVVNIPIAPFDIIREIHKMDSHIKNYGFVHYLKNVQCVQEIAEICDINIKEYRFLNFMDISDAIEDAQKTGVECIIGGEVAVRLAKKKKLMAIQIGSSDETVERAIDEAVNSWQQIQKEKRRHEQIQAAYNSLKEGIIVTDDEERIIMANRVASKIYGRRLIVGEFAGKDIIDRQCQEVYRSKKDIPIYLQKFQKDTYSTAHFPIEKDGKFLGVVSRYEDVTKTQELEHKIRSELHKKGFVAKYNFEDIITGDFAMKKLISKAKIYAKTDSAVLIEGESGTGKELFAQSIHNASKRSLKPFIAVNCAAIPENLLESELFGYEAGAFTGAKKEGKQGLFEQAHEGTLFLDEIGEVSKNVQTRLLRVLQEKEIMRVGGNKIIPVDVRIISATNKDLRKMSEEGDFRSDLYYRLNVLKLNVPALRNRKGDVKLLSNTFLKKYCRYETCPPIIENILASHSWPGNIRELQNIVERFGVLLNILGDSVLEDEDMLDIFTINSGEGSMQRAFSMDISEGESLSDIIKNVEERVIRYYIDKYDGDQENAAKALGISKTTLWRKYKA